MSSVHKCDEVLTQEFGVTKTRVVAAPSPASVIPATAMLSEQGSGQQRPRSTGGLPRRTTDRVEDAVAWLLSALGPFALLAAVIVGVSVDGTGVERGRVESAERNLVDAVLLEPVPTAFGGPVTGVQPVLATSARYVDLQGTAHEVIISVPGPRAAGVTVPVWVDRNGSVVPPPAGSLAFVTGVMVGAAVAALACVLLTLGWLVLLDTSLGRVNAAAWNRQCKGFEPQWSGRIPGPGPRPKEEGRI